MRAADTKKRGPAPTERTPEKTAEIQNQYIAKSAYGQDRGGADRHEAARDLLVLQAKIERLIELDPARAEEFGELLRAVGRALSEIVGGRHDHRR